MAINCEYMFSNPTGLFNLSIPKKEMRTKNYQVITYEMHKRVMHQGPQEDVKIETRDWEELKQENDVLLKIVSENKSTFIVKVQVRILAEDEATCNVRLPKSTINAKLMRGDSKVMLHLQKIDPTKPFGQLKIEIVKVKGQQVGQRQHIVTQMATNDYVSYMTPTTYNYGVGSGMERQQSNDEQDYTIYGNAQVQCRKCNEYNDQSEIQCKSC